MSYNTIMVQMDLDAPLAPLLDFGLSLARPFESDLIAFAAAEPFAFVPGDEGGIATAEILQLQTEEINERLAAMKEEFLAKAGEDRHAHWQGLVGNPTSLLALHARCADLIVIGTPKPQPQRNSQRTVDPGSLILSAGRPVFVAGSNLADARIDKVVLAWKDTREARRAAADAMPFLEKAKEVLVVTIEKGDPTRARESAGDVVRFLMRHGVKARADILRGADADVEDVLAKVANDMKADLVVAGGYGHSRLREWVFGGVTRSLLGDGSVHRLFSN